MLVRAMDRFTLLGYGFEDQAMTGLSEPSKYSQRWTVYVCSKCHTQTGFEWTDFAKHVGRLFSNLMYPDRQAVEREVTDKLTDENSFLDFYCSGCNGVVRVYYRYDPPEERVHIGRLVLKTVVERPSLVTKPC